MADAIHSSDSLYHKLFAYPEMVADLLQNFLDPNILAELDLSRMRRLNTKFTAKTGQRRRGDIVWEIPIRAGGSLFLLLLLEFQSEIDEWMVLRLERLHRSALPAVGGRAQIETGRWTATCPAGCHIQW
ncbi:Rpn family recombination-promoting nuclease/putative transposase [Candidatus Magnetobacterium casense]|uniref:Rpn family recombination-promoting nuclease/putative transposase n=1 Tax=Candidatus Magnetobacterium casense TaxID=1455061 RepID=A0ABS6S343_9BACT|nr:Rpn family recombination-promoting nuclease/putative transposase [Candidatus Magnetobacterium casensis]MBV6342813.1 Rpn family recombination-promoting nuclease/putative transposase [Candidatus Magnetobacterium casensis]